MILDGLFIFVIVVFAIVLHECAHGWMAYRLGDPTAKIMGRLTLNPLKHIDPVGTVLVPFVLYLLHVLTRTHLFMFGWAKPVPVNFQALGEPRRDKILVALAGPVMNLLVAFCLAQVIHAGLFPSGKGLLETGVLLNVMLAVFNLIPIPPLDGSRVVSGFLPDEMDRVYSQIEPFGIIVVILLLNSSLLDFIYPVIEWVMRGMGIML